MVGLAQSLCEWPWPGADELLAVFPPGVLLDSLLNTVSPDGKLTVVKVVSFEFSAILRKIIELLQELQARHVLAGFPAPKYRIYMKPGLLYF